MTLEQRIKIAEACGWVRGYSGDLQWVNDPNGIRIGCSSIRNVADQALPDYLNDLNAMHEAVSTLNFSQRIKYRKQLQLELSNNMHNALVHMHECIDAKASHRAAAFLKALNLWQE